ncbi:MAG TPA: hypothetical protein VK250_01955 [Nitrososphaeraceae archaeon]|nr:hypothetical protein [Nitrososphaeraceae archaeon]
MRNPVFTAVLLSVLLLSGVIATSMVSFIGAEASSDKQEKKKEKDKKDYYENYNEVKDVYESTDHDSYKMPTTDQYSDGYNTNDYAAEADQYSDGYKTDGYVSEQDKQVKYKDDDKGDYKNNDKKAIKKIKIIECRNSNLNGDTLDDIETVESMKSENPIVKQLENHQLGNQMTEYNQYNGGVYEFYIDSDTKIVFICSNENYNLDSDNNIDALKATNTNSTTIETTESGNGTTATMDSNDNADTRNEIETTESGNAIVQQKQQEQPVQQQEQIQQQEQQKDTRLLNSGNAIATDDPDDRVDLVTNEMISGQNTDSSSKMDVDTTPNYLNIIK